MLLTAYSVQVERRKESAAADVATYTRFTYTRKRDYSYELVRTTINQAVVSFHFSTYELVSRVQQLVVLRVLPNSSTHEHTQGHHRSRTIPIISLGTSYYQQPVAQEGQQATVCCAAIYGVCCIMTGYLALTRYNQAKKEATT